ncbi:hypothetical protein ACFO6R_16045 [Eubacterium multiforme]|uniref:Uncharacterized protein n=1 Tax=Eubacterium multiforme TaxID=83339 RepID=A0ABT9UTK3_9FIRM|nr:hypothetical protein [Eubacterium multiforme]MDQ0149626.1 hypothetical protein [Eubacterium multiforme]
MAFKKFEDIKIKNNIENTKEKKKKLSKIEKKELKAERKKLKAEEKKEKELLKKIPSNVLEEMQVLDVTDEVQGDNFIKTKNGYLNLYQIVGINIIALNDIEQLRIINDFSSFIRAYNKDYKIVIMNFPVSTAVQQQNLLEKINNCKNKLFKEQLERKLEELKILEKDKTNTEYYLETFYDDNANLEVERNSLEQCLKRNFNLIELDLEKKLKILCKLHNLNSKLM